MKNTRLTGAGVASSAIFIVLMLVLIAGFSMIYESEMCMDFGKKISVSLSGVACR